MWALRLCGSDFVISVLVYIVQSKGVLTMSLISSLAYEDASIWQILFEYFVDIFIYPENIVFDNLNMSLDTMITIRNIIVGLFAGVIIASLMAIHTKKVLGAFVRKLLSDEIFSEEKAIRLAATGFVTNFSVRNALKKGRTLRCVVKCREEEEHLRATEAARLEYEKRKSEGEALPDFIPTAYIPDPDSDHFYIPEELKYQAELRFDNRGTTWLAFIGVIIVSIIAFCALMLVIPEILQLFDSIAGSFDGVPDNIVV